ncbi:MAG: hypothetical protein M1469_11685 [Bacteroidetes bacterium]|nr:hypothetical protein [Bacteroidota bacterium]
MKIASIPLTEKSFGEWGATASSPVKKCTPDAFLMIKKAVPIASAGRAGKDEMETDTLIASTIETSLVLRALISFVSNSAVIPNAIPLIGR